MDTLIRKYNRHLFNSKMKSEKIKKLTAQGLQQRRSLARPWWILCHRRGSRLVAPSDRWCSSSLAWSRSSGRRAPSASTLGCRDSIVALVRKRHCTRLTPATGSSGNREYYISVYCNTFHFE